MLSTIFSVYAFMMELGKYLCANDGVGGDNNPSENGSQPSPK